MILRQRSESSSACARRSASQTVRVTSNTLVELDDLAHASEVEERVGLQLVVGERVLGALEPHVLRRPPERLVRPVDWNAGSARRHRRRRRRLARHLLLLDKLVLLPARHHHRQIN